LVSPVTPVRPLPPRAARSHTAVCPPLVGKEPLRPPPRRPAAASSAPGPHVFRATLLLCLLHENSAPRLPGERRGLGLRRCKAWRIRFRHQRRVGHNAVRAPYGGGI